MVLWQLGIFSGIGGGANKSVGFNVVSPVDKTIYYSGNALNFTIENRAGNKITFTTNCVVSGSGCATANCDVGTDGIESGNASLAPGQSKDVACTGCDILTAGDSFTVDVTFEYIEKVADRILTKSETGTIRGKAD